MSFCLNCGQPHPDEARFCKNCGQSLPDAAPAISTARKIADQIAHESLEETDWHLRHTEVTFRGTRVTGKTFYAFCFGLFCGVMLLTTAVGYFTKNVSLICLGGLLWIGFLMALFTIARFVRFLLLIAAVLAKTFAGYLQTTGNEILLLASYLPRAAKSILQHLGSFVYTVMAFLAVCMEAITRFHLHLARVAIETPKPETEVSFAKLSVVSLAFLGIGLIASLSALLHEWTNKLIKVWTAPGSCVAYVTSFECFRSVLLLLTGLWGIEAFQFGSLFLNIPSNASLADRADGALRLYQIQGSGYYNLLFAILPLSFIAISFIDHERTKRSKAPTAPMFGLHHWASVTAAVTMLLFSLTVWGRMGIVQRYALSFSYHFRDNPLDRQLSSCLWQSSSNQSDYQCLLTWKTQLSQVLEQEFATLDPKLSKQRRLIVHKQKDEWQKNEVDAAIAAFYSSNDPAQKFEILRSLGENIADNIRRVRYALLPSTPKRRRGNRVTPTHSTQASPIHTPP
jgi:hypothetical protein